MTVAVAFPGQGAYSAEAARSLVETFPEVAQVYAEVDEGARAAGAAPVSDLLRSPQPPAASELLAAAPESLQLSIYAVSVAISRLVTPATGWSAVSFGHSLGEIAALQAGGAFTVSGGAEIVAHRARALRAVDGEGGLLALACDASRARDLLDLLGSPDLAVAALNAPRQTVVSGPHADLATVAAVATALRIGASALPSPYAFHNPRLGPVADDFAARIEHVSVSALSRPVYSPIIGRFYEDSDDVRTLVTRHLVDPVDFVSTVRQLRAAGVTAILECASGTTLGTLATRSTEGVETTSAAQRGNERAGVEQARRLLAAGDVPAYFASAPLPVQQAPGQAVPHQAAPEETMPYQPVPVPVERVPVQQVVVGSQRASDQASWGAQSVGGRAELFGELAAMYAEALEYPAEVFSEDVALEAELGVDSVKQTELFARTVERYELALPDEAVPLAQFDTMGKVVDLVWSLMPHPSPLPVRSAA